MTCDDVAVCIDQGREERGEGRGRKGLKSQGAKSRREGSTKRRKLMGRERSAEGNKERVETRKKPEPIV